MGILLKNILIDGKKTNISIEENRISEIGERAAAGDANHVLDCDGMAAIPGFVNTHTHAAMTLFRGDGDDMRLMDWLQNKIWPAEAKLTEDDVYVGTKLACLEMIKSGTTTFSDMYWHLPGAAKAVKESGMRAALSSVFLDHFDEQKAEEQRSQTEHLHKRFGDGKFSSRITFGLGPHAIYTVSPESLRWISDFAKEKQCPVNFHLAETEQENTDFVKTHGTRPVPFLESMGFLGKHLIAAHSICYTTDEIKTLARSGVHASHCPISNMKLCSGPGVLNYPAMRAAGMNVSLGTDGAASNNNLDMFDTMKFASLLQKHNTRDPTVMDASETLRMATQNGARALGIDSGVIAEGKLADIAIIDLRRSELTPHFNLASDLVYAANGSCVDSLICDGKLLMKHRKVKGERKILEEAAKRAKEVVMR